MSILLLLVCFPCFWIRRRRRWYGVVGDVAIATELNAITILCAILSSIAVFEMNACLWHVIDGTGWKYLCMHVWKSMSIWCYHYGLTHDEKELLSPLVLRSLSNKQHARIIPVVGCSSSNKPHHGTAHDNICVFYSTFLIIQQMQWNIV